jgi:hypothetical protein
MLPVSLDCPFLIASSVFSNVYFRGTYIYNFPLQQLEICLFKNGVNNSLFNIKPFQISKEHRCRSDKNEKKKKYHTEGTISKSSIKIVERGKIDTPSVSYSNTLPDLSGNLFKLSIHI